METDARKVPASHSAAFNGPSRFVNQSVAFFTHHLYPRTLTAARANPFSRNLNTLYPRPTYICISDRYFRLLCYPLASSRSDPFALPRRFPRTRIAVSTWITRRGVPRRGLTEFLVSPPFSLSDGSRFFDNASDFDLYDATDSLNHPRVHRHGNYKFMSPTKRRARGPGPFAFRETPLTIAFGQPSLFRLLPAIVPAVDR